MRQRLPWLLLLLFVIASPLSVRTAQAADEPWEKSVRLQIEDQDRRLQNARRRGTTRQIVTTYASRLGRQPSALNHFLLGRALYYDGDKAGAERHLRDTLRLEPRFWFAKLRLALLELERGNKTLGEQYLRDVLRLEPNEPDALKLWAMLRGDQKDWDGALRALEKLRALDPADEDIRLKIATVLMAKEDWAAALQELKVLRGRNRKNPMIRAAYAQALFQTGHYKEAAGELEILARMNPKDPRFLDMLRVCYWRLKDWPSLIRAMERMAPLMPEGKDKEMMTSALERLRAGEVPTDGPSPQDVQRDPFAMLVEAAVHPTDVSMRRAALQQYYTADIGMLPAVMVVRVRADDEPDAVCRQWILRIMGKLANPALAQVVAYGLFDPESAVRAKAAEALGEIKTPSGLLYLIPFVISGKAESAPTTERIEELNAARSAMIRTAGRQDAFGGADQWVPGEKIAEMVHDWRVWLRSPAGVHARIRGIQDLGEQREPNPHLYVIEDITDPSERSDVSFAAYKLIRERAARPSEERVAKTMWPRLPKFADADLTAANLPRLRKEVKGWWDAWLKMRRGS